MLTINSQLEATTDELESTLKKEQESKQELEATHDQLKEAQTQLLQSEKMSSLGQMTAGVAHEINNPINFVSGGIQSLESVFEELLEYVNQYKGSEDLPADQLAERFAKINEIKKEIDLEETLEDFFALMKDIKHGADRTAEIVKGLQNFSRMDGGEYDITNIHEGLDSTLMLLRSKMANIELVKEYDKNLPPILCFPSELNQVFMNLLANAIDAMNGKRKLVVSTQDLPREIRISIQDSGVGMPQSVIDKIFDPFFTTKEIGKGTGLGLSISYGIIQKHNGKLLVESKEGEGTIFTVLIPKKTVE
ncbi:MAG: signal transduction histidine kinase [Bacteroidia bacterium]